MTMEVKHIGIVACSAEGAALCYRPICSEASKQMGGHNHLEISTHTIPLADCMVGIEGDDWEGGAELMLRSARKLAAIGADFLICPDNTIHQSFVSVEANSPLPWLHIARVVCESGASRGFKQLGITGTKFLTEGPVYSGVAKMVDLNTVTPGVDRRNRINDIIFDQLVYGDIRDTSRDYFVETIGILADQGCDAVVLGCTEIPLIVNDSISSLPTLDPTRRLARAALHHAIT
jgi:aspartate racemase